MSDRTFNPDDYGPAISSLLVRDRERPLTAGAIDPHLSNALSQLALAEAFAPATITDRQAALACIAGLWLLADDLDSSHRLSQDLDTPEGSFWHGIMHRREGDFGNAKYWFRRAGEHPVFDRLSEHDKLEGEWDPYTFVDMCQRASQDDQLAARCRRWQQIEWESLFDYCYHLATDS